ncbi:hypothetical protein [Roseateles sp.]
MMKRLLPTLTLSVALAVATVQAQVDTRAVPAQPRASTLPGTGWTPCPT